VDKLAWQGRLISVQPRIRLTRSFDERTHSYLGYALRVDGEVSGTAKVFSVGIGKAAQAKLELQVGDVVSGLAIPVADPRHEPVDLYRSSRLRVAERASGAVPPSPPLMGVPPALPVYRERGHRRLDARTYEAKCSACIWGCRMPVELIIDHWNPSRRKHRFETFCYGPKSCTFYRAGATRKVQGRKPGMVHEEQDWVDEDATRHRGPDE